MNIITNPENFANGVSWFNQSAETVVTVNQAVALDGTTTADALTDSAGGAAGLIGTAQPVTAATSTAYTFSCFIKPNASLTWVSLRLVAFTTPINSEAWFDVQSGSVGTVDAGISDSGIVAHNDGWFRCWVKFTTDGTDTAGQVRIYNADADADLNVTRDGSKISYLWGAQLEVGDLTNYTSVAGVTIGGASGITGPGLSFGMMGRLGS